MLPTTLDKKSDDYPSTRLDLEVLPCDQDNLRGEDLALAEEKEEGLTLGEKQDRLTSLILASSIKEDQERVANVWADTYLHQGSKDPNDSNNLAIQMTQLMLSCVARGDFKTQAHHSRSPELQAPSDSFTNVDYLSHASRIILDYEKLSLQHREELLSYFPKATPKAALTARVATHAVVRQQGKALELKGRMLGFYGLFAQFGRTAVDFGINLAMGGKGKKNGVGREISDNGYSGHFYVHLNEVDNLLLLGLEQTAPLGMDAHSVSENEQQGEDQFGQKHSLLGSSDTYTAAASLYFDNPVYMAKCMLEEGCFPPEKYGGMQVNLDDENWPEIKKFLEKLQLSVANNDREVLLQALRAKPSTALPNQEVYSSYMDLKFASYLEQILQLVKKLDPFQQEALKIQHAKLLQYCEEIKKRQFDHYSDFSALIQTIGSNEELPLNYRFAIQGIEKLAELQLAIEEDPLAKYLYRAVLFKESKTYTDQLEELQQFFQDEPVLIDDFTMTSSDEMIGELQEELIRIHNLFLPIPEDKQEDWVDLGAKPPVPIYRSSNEIKQGFSQAKALLEKARSQQAKLRRFAEEESSQEDLQLLHYEMLLYTKLIPLTKGYLAHLDSEKEKINSEEGSNQDLLDNKLAFVKKLVESLENKQFSPKDSVEAFTNLVSSEENPLAQHRDSAGVQFVRDCFILLGIVGTGIVPGIAAIWSYSWYSGRPFMFFHQSQGEQFLQESLNQVDQIKVVSNN